ncbi:hypothetical protein L9F63_003274, partial [Diploptera punctata]
MSFEQEENSSCETECDNMSGGGADGDSDDDSEDNENCHNLVVVKPSNLQLNNDPMLHDVPRIRWSPGSWQDGTRKSAFQPYRPTLVLTNLQRGNIPTESSAPEHTDVSFHHRAGQGEINVHDIEQEQDIDVKDSNGLSALMWASAYGQVPTVQLLVQHGAQVDLQGQEGETSLLLAAASGHYEVVRLLLTEGAAVNHADEIGNTSLMYSVHGDHPHCTNELLLRGADITVVNLNGDTAYGIAVKRGSKL